MLTQEASEKEKERKGPWPGIFPLGGGSGQRVKDPEERRDNKLGEFGIGSFHLSEGKDYCQGRGNIIK